MPPVKICDHVTVPINEWGNAQQMPDDFWPVRSHAPFGAGDWAGGVYMCARCERCAILYYNPKDDVFDGCLLLPEVFKLACRRAVSVDAMEQLLGYRYEGFSVKDPLRSLTKACLSHAEYDIQGMFNMLLHRLDRSRDDIAFRQNADWLFIFVSGERVQAHWRATDGRQSVLRSDILIYGIARLIMFLHFLMWLKLLSKFTKRPA